MNAKNKFKRCYKAGMTTKSNKRKNITELKIYPVQTQKAMLTSLIFTT